MSAKATQQGDHEANSTDDVSEMIHTSHVEGTDVWITEHVVDDADEGVAPHTIRCTWRVHEVGPTEWIVALDKQRRMFNGAANEYGHTELECHADDLERALNRHFLDVSRCRSSEGLDVEFRGVERSEGGE